VNHGSLVKIFLLTTLLKLFDFCLESIENFDEESLSSEDDQDESNNQVDILKIFFTDYCFYLLVVRAEQFDE
jgi:hypothetical protein